MCEGAENWHYPSLSPQDATPSEMPMWMAALHKKFNDSQTHQNVRIFLARLVSNRSKLFQPYAKFWVTPLAQFIVGGANGGVGLHYFVVDLMVTLLSWTPTFAMEVSSDITSGYLLGILVYYRIS